MKIYISIPITGQDYEAQKRKAEQIATCIELAGHEPENPFNAPQPHDTLNEAQKYAFYMGYDIERLLQCDAIYLSKGWEGSKGCQLENSAAQIYQLREFTSITEIPGFEDL